MHVSGRFPGPLRCVIDVFHNIELFGLSPGNLGDLGSD